MQIYRAGAAVAFAILLGAGGSGGAAIEQETQDKALTHNIVTIAHIPAPVADTLRKILGNRRPGEIREIRWDAIPVLYETEFADGRRKVEVVILTDGARVPAGKLRGRAAVKERAIEAKDLPPAVAEALAKQLGAGPFEGTKELQYKAVVVLYEAGDANTTVWFYPSGVLAREQRKPQDTEAAEDAGDEPDLS